MYHPAIANTNATRIGVLEVEADDRHQCGIFSPKAWHPYGRAVWESRKTRRSLTRYANPAQSAPPPDWRRGERNQNPHSRSNAMNDKVKVTASAKCPPWAGYASPNVLTVKVGGYFFTIEVQK